MATEREKDRGAELESALYTNCLLLDLDPAFLGGGNCGVGSRVGHFRHSNPRMGEQLLYFLLSALRGPAQSAKDLDKVWPIFDSAQSRDFRKVVQGIISELEAQGALPRSNSRVSSLATCCGPRFVELLWQLSVHALREVHRRTFAVDVASNPLPVSLTDVSYLHAAALLPVSKDPFLMGEGVGDDDVDDICNILKARIALERRKFLKKANAAVHKQTAWSNLAQKMTAEFRGHCAEEAYLQQELEKLQEMRSKAKLEAELWDDRISTSAPSSHIVSKATSLWESLLARKSQHEVLASGPIEDLIAHREHRYRISGSSLIAAMDQSSQAPYSDVPSARAGEISPQISNREQTDLSQIQGNKNNDSLPRTEDRNGRGHTTIDVAEILRRWTHALQRIHKQSLHLAKANDGEGPELLRCASDSSTSGHAESLAATLAEHRQHLASIQGLINQLKEAVPTMQKSIAELTEEVNIIAPYPMDEYSARSISSVHAQSSGRSLENNSDEVKEMASKLCSAYLETSSNSPALKLPHLFGSTPNSSGKGLHTPKQYSASTQPIHTESLVVGKPIHPPFTNDDAECALQDHDGDNPQTIRRAVREAALSKPLSNSEWSEDKSSDDGSEHFFVPLSADVPRKGVGAAPNRRKQQLFSSPPQIRNTKNIRGQTYNTESRFSSVSNNSNGLADYESGFDSAISMGSTGSGVQNTFPDIDESPNQVFSPPLLMDTSFYPDIYEDLLAPLSAADTALMER